MRARPVITPAQRPERSRGGVGFPWELCPQARDDLDTAWGDNALMSDVLELVDVSVVRDGRALVEDVSWSVKEGERWVILGPNGAGKTTLLNIASSYLFPSTGTATVLGERLGGVGTDVFDLRPRIGIAGMAMADKMPKRQTVLQTVLTAAYGMTATWHENYDTVDEDRARAFLDRLGMTGFLERRFGTLSEGERKRTLIARAMMTDPELLLLDEPAAGLDLGGREDLVRRLGRLARDPLAPSMIMVTHHVEEIAPGFTHVLMIRQGKVLAAGPMETELSSRNLSLCFGLPLIVEHTGDRYTAHGLPLS
ncbi:ABC transporter ATP-binding protein [Streptomyces fulvorobeus]|uniref:ABC transporter ATP-binding protein n=2 Tax=Streptomyces fulvorobeus TaxID=284028 RepID=A0A7J0C1D9_9ACTN|nr:ABC transporter ATP-binding protein [Streptomyces fulvorobeus]